MLYEPTPVEFTPQASAYDHLPSYTSLAPTPTPARAAAAGKPPNPRSWRRAVSWLAGATVIILLLVTQRPSPAPPEPLFGQARATAPTFSVALLNGTPQYLQDPSMALRIVLSASETFTVWASSTSAVQPCDTEVAQRAAARTSGARTSVTVDLDGTPAVGTRIIDPASDTTVVCTQRKGMRYVIDDTAVATGSSFATMAESWRWS